MTRQETVLSLWSTFTSSQAYGTFLRFEAFAGRSGRAMDGRWAPGGWLHRYHLVAVSGFYRPLGDVPGPRSREAGHL